MFLGPGASLSKYNQNDQNNSNQNPNPNKNQLCHICEHPILDNTIKVKRGEIIAYFHAIHFNCHSCAMPLEVFSILKKLFFLF